MKKALFLYSDHTGLSRKQKRIQKAIVRLSKVFELTPCKTSTLDEMKEKVALACASFDVLIVVGGDGSFHQAINVVAKAERQPILGFINAGTMGDVASNFGTSHSFWKGVKTIENGYTSQMDLCSANDIYFAYMAAVGAYSDISYRASRSSKRVIGKLSYYALAIKEAFRRQNVKLNLVLNEGHIQYDGPFLLLLNGGRVGGFYVNRKGRMNDGKLEAFLTPKGLFNGLLRYLTPKKRWKQSLPSLRIESENELPWCLDGEKYVFTTLNINCCQSKIRVFCRKGSK